MDLISPKQLSGCGWEGKEVSGVQPLLCREAVRKGEKSGEKLGKNLVMNIYTIYIYILSFLLSLIF